MAEESGKPGVRKGLIIILCLGILVVNIVCLVKVIFLDSCVRTNFETILGFLNRESIQQIDGEIREKAFVTSDPRMAETVSSVGSETRVISEVKEKPSITACEKTDGTVTSVSSGTMAYNLVYDPTSKEERKIEDVIKKYKAKFPRICSEKNLQCLRLGLLAGLRYKDLYICDPTGDEDELFGGISSITTEIVVWGKIYDPLPREKEKIEISVKEYQSQNPKFFRSKEDVLAFSIGILYALREDDWSPIIYNPTEEEKKIIEMKVQRLNRGNYSEGELLLYKKNVLSEIREANAMVRCEEFMKALPAIEKGLEKIRQTMKELGQSENKAEQPDTGSQKEEGK